MNLKKKNSINSLFCMTKWKKLTMRQKNKMTFLKKGFSLIEMMVAIAIGSVLVAVIVLFFFFFMNDKTVDISPHQIFFFENKPSFAFQGRCFYRTELFQHRNASVSFGGNKRHFSKRGRDKPCVSKIDR